MKLLPQFRRSVLPAKNTILIFPINSINWCLKESGITAQELDFVVFYDKPFIKFERILETYLCMRRRV